MRLADTLYFSFGGGSGGADTASSTAPVGQHPESDGTTKRDRNQKGGPDKGGVAAEGKKLVCFDFDGVLAKYDGWKGSDVTGSPIAKGVSLARKLHEQGYDVCVLTARKKLSVVQKFLKDNGLSFAKATNVKPPAAAYIDDRAIRWPTTEAEVMKKLEAGGLGSGCKGPNCGRKTLYHGTTIENAKSILKHGFDPKKNLTKSSVEDPHTTSFTTNKQTAAGAYGNVDSFKKSPGGKIRLIPGGGRGAIVRVDVPQELLKKFTSHDSVGEAYGEYNVPGGKLDRRYIHSVEIYDGGKKTVLHATSGGQSEGSSLTARKFYVVDGQGRVLHTFKTREEAEQASAGNRYTKVVTHVEQGTPLSDTPEVRDMARKRLITPVQTFRRALPYPGSLGGIYPGSPQGR